MRFSVGHLTASTLLFSMVQSVSAQVSITQIESKPIVGQVGTELSIVFDGVPPSPEAYQLEQPQRLILDFKDTLQLRDTKTLKVEGSEASRIDLSADAKRARISVNLKSKQSFSSRIEGNRFILRIQPAVSKPNSVVPKSAAPKNVAPKNSELSHQTQQGVAKIGFQRAQQGEAQIVVDLLGRHTPIDIQQQGNQVVLRVLGQPLSSKLLQRLNVLDFATMVSTIEAYNASGDGFIRIKATDDFEYMAYQTENKLIVSLKPPVTDAVRQDHSEQPHYSGKKLSLDFQDIEVRRVLQLLADFTGINLVAADSVQGNITLRLKDVPWDQALDLILKTKGLDKRRNGNAIWVAPMAELIKTEEDEAKFAAQSLKTAVLQTEYIQLKYAKASDIEKLITQGRSQTQPDEKAASGNSSAAQQDNNGSLLSHRGRVAIDPRTNTLIISDTVQKIEQIRKMIDLLDVAVKQVMIEARIVRASTDFTKEMGVKWGMLATGHDANVGGSDTTLWDLRTPKASVQPGGMRYDITRPDNLNVDLGVSGDGASRIAFGLLSVSNFMLDLELSALQADGYGEVISTPKVMTADKQKAKVASGQQVPYQTRETSSTGGSSSSTSFKDALLSLDVTPSITPDGKVQMQLIISSDSPAGTAPNGEIILNKNEINTNVLVSNGETVVLGGIFEQETRNRQTKVPLLGDIPVLGRLFRRDEKSDKKSELLIFVTPRIVNDSLTRNH
ncbi:type IV pilus assembly protein PilQ [Acinetobacter calcoaceticus]|uniref:Type IV pilus assembly protein PilQ n=1 Tax=Acinetobacter calcoaceticus TaxID=471 RepID=A0A4R1Y926_ACICA|nr:type IV pilus assembly protein PilQ [Acinetobacter calcoaceticus]